MSDQTAQYVDKWTKIGLSCEPCDRKRVVRAINLAYKIAGLKPPATVIIAGGPISGELIVNNLKGDTVRDSVREYVLASAEDSAGGGIWNSIPHSVWDNIRESVWDIVRENVRVNVGTKIRDSVWESALDNIRDQWFCSHNAGFLAFVDYCRSVLGLKEQTEKMQGLITLAQECGWCATYADVAIVQHRHCELHLRDGKLHRDGGPAVKYPDGWGVYALNGVRVPEWLAVKKADKISAAKFLELKNVEVRREFIRKVGLARVAQKLGPVVIDELVEVTGGPYRLLEFKIGDTVARALHMINPSIGTDHVEFVPREVETVEQAIHWRKPDAMRLIPVACDGAEWQQHGDVCIWPQGSRTLQPFPKEIS